jgi:hypothetical protein
MSRRFSWRHRLDPEVPTQEVVEDAPEALRRHFVLSVLRPLTFVDQDHRYDNSEGRPLGIKSLGEQLYVLFHTDPPASLFDSWVCQDALEALVLTCPWYHFYDAVEVIGTALKEVAQYHKEDNEWLSAFGFETYQSDVNALLSEWAVVWRLNHEGMLERDTPEELSSGLTLLDAALVGPYEAARLHFGKARRLALGLPPDPENAIKEAVSGLESVGRVIFPGASTLGDVVKMLRRRGFSPGMATVIEKFYAFASSEPGVRHGAIVSPRMTLADADLCLYVSTALTMYLLEWSKSREPANTP